MSLESTSKLTRICVFYDGNYFLHVSNYYAFNHLRNSRISISGLHEFIRHQVAAMENEDVRLCQIVDSHFFRGRIPAQEAQQRGNLLYYERVFDDILMWEGVTTHYLPLRNNGGRREEKGIDVWMALEAYEMCLLKKLDVVVLITADGDYVPLVRKLNTLGTRVMVLSWDFEFMDQEGKQVVTRTSQDLLEEVTYPVSMHEVIETRTRKNDPLVQNLFVTNETRQSRPAQITPHYSREQFPHQAFTAPAPANGGVPTIPVPEEFDDQGQDRFDSDILSLKNGYGFIKYPPNNLFFHHKDLLNAQFPELQEGDPVEFSIGYNAEGEPVAKNVRWMAFEES